MTSGSQRSFILLDGAIFVLIGAFLATVLAPVVVIGSGVIAGITNVTGNVDVAETSRDVAHGASIAVVVAALVSFASLALVVANGPGGSSSGAYGGVGAIVLFGLFGITVGDIALIILDGLGGLAVAAVASLLAGCILHAIPLLAVGPTSGRYPQVVRSAASLLPVADRDEYREEWARWMADMRRNGTPRLRRWIEAVTIVFIAAPRLAIMLRLGARREEDR